MPPIPGHPASRPMVAAPRACAALLLAAATVSTGGLARAQDWTALTPAVGPMPAPRTQCSAIFDVPNRHMVIFGGRGDSGPLNDVWAFDLVTLTWTELTPGAGSMPAPRFTPASVYDPVGHRMITWSGQGSGGAFFNDAWSFDLDTNAWTALSPAGGPPNIRYGVARVFDPVGRDLVTFAGFTNLGRFDDVWRLDADAVTWTDVSPGSGPIERCLHTASYDAMRGRMIMYGGQKSGPLGDIWALDLSNDTWTELTPGSSPPGRYFATSVYDSLNDRLIVFGGTTTGGKQNEAWAFDLATDTWSLLTPGGTAPSARDGAVAIYDGALDRLVVFGGEDTGRLNDVWALEHLTPSAGVGNGPARALELRAAPNPSAPGAVTTLSFSLARTTPVTLRIHDVSGRVVRTLVDGARTAGPHAVTWDGRDRAGRVLPAGVYLLRLEAGDASASRKLMRLR